MKTKIILLLAISVLFAGCVQEEADEKFNVVEIMNESCTADSECVTPEDYLMRSVCPYTSKCIDNRCTVICPEGWESPEEPIGGERDEHGCLGPAGYTWDEDIGACIRGWELNENQKKAAKIAAAPLSYPVTVVDVAVAGCPGCFSIHLQRNDNQEELTVTLENWEIAEPVACQEDAKICHDGTVVVRVAPDCEFAPCPSQEMSEELCSSAGGNWNECSSRCQLDSQGRSDIACSAVCEALCECDGIAGFACPEGYTCKTPSGIADALGYCVKAESEITASEFCDDENVDSVYVCGDYIKVVSSLAGGGSTFYKDGEEIRCPVVAPDYMSDECKAMLKSDCKEACDLSVVDANNEFALDLYKELKASDGNIFYSPWSILSALAMTYEGAMGQTAEEMREVLHLPGDDETRRNSFKEVQDGINKEDKDYELYTANALWPQTGYSFLDSYINTIRTYYGGEVTALDYVSETEESRQTINSWVEEKTNDKIMDLIPAGVLGPLTRMVLTNAIYFKGTWVMQFDEEDTTDQDFHVSPEETVTAQMMSLTGDEARFNYAEDEDVQFLELPYEGEEVSMLVILPRENDLEYVEGSLSADDISRWRSDLSEQEVHVYLPKFKLETKYFLPEVLKELNMVDAFDSEVADFSGMDGTTDLFISDVIHQAFVEVNEEGTEAAAATAVIVGRTSAQPRHKVFIADHPFIFIIQEKETGNILFMGRVTDPS